MHCPYFYGMVIKIIKLSSQHVIFVAFLSLTATSTISILQVAFVFFLILWYFPEWIVSFILFNCAWRLHETYTTAMDERREINDALGFTTN